MKEISVGILDQDRIYAERLARYLLLEAETPFSVRIFSEPEKAKKGLAERRLCILIVDVRWMEDDFLSEDDGCMVMLLAEKRSEAEAWGCPFLYRYQSGRETERLLREAVSREEEEIGLFDAEEAGRLIGVYSPLGRCGKTAFSLALGLCLSRFGRVIYWSLDSPGGWKGLSGESGRELSELFYYFRQGKSLSEPFSQRKIRLSGMEAVPVEREPLFLREVAEEDVIGLARALLKDTGSRWLVLDVGQGFCRPEKILEQCDRVYVPVLEDTLSREKLKQAHLLFREREKSGGIRSGGFETLLLPKTEPETSDEEGISRLLWGRLGAVAEKKAEELQYGNTEGIAQPGTGAAGSGAGSG